MDHGYFVDEDKNLYRREGAAPRLVARLRKNPFRIESDGSRTFLIDTFGDVFVIEEECRFVFGVLGKPVDFKLRGSIYVLDGHGRVWVAQPSGVISGILFSGIAGGEIRVSGRHLVVVETGRRAAVFGLASGEKRVVECEEVLGCSEDGVRVVAGGKECLIDDI